LNETVKKRWLFDPFWRQKQKAIVESGQHDSAGTSSSYSEVDDHQQVMMIERLLVEQQRLQTELKKLTLIGYLNLLLAWLVAFALTFGEIPWFLVKLWEFLVWGYELVAAP
jgi:hypothetical protein